MSQERNRTSERLPFFPEEDAESSQPAMYPRSKPPSDFSPPLILTSRSRKVVRRMLSPFSMMLLLIGGAVAIVLYISNIIAVNQLLNEINALEAEHRRILMDQEILKAQINRMASLERIQERAESELGLKSLREPPVWLELDWEKVKELEDLKTTR